MAFPPDCIKQYTLAKIIVKYYIKEESMPKDSQIDPKEVREKKSNGGPTIANDALDGEGRNNKKQSGNRHKPGNDK